MFINRDEAIKILATEALQYLTVYDRESILVSDWLGADDEDGKYLELGNDIKQCLQKFSTMLDFDQSFLDEVEDIKFNPLLLQSLQNEYLGVQNKYINSRLSKLGYDNLVIVGEPANLFPCDCCGYKTLANRYEYDICPVCFWEDSGVNSVTGYSSPNHSTLSAAKENFSKYGACSKDAVNFVDREGPKKYQK